jgi:hypothetical protein
MDRQVSMMVAGKLVGGVLRRWHLPITRANLAFCIGSRR